MNKAFLKELDAPTDQHCPKCGALATAVGRETLAAHLADDAVRTLAESAYFCRWPDCDVAYFDQFGRIVCRDALLRPVYPKDRTAAICACFGLTRDDIEQDLREGVVTRCRDIVNRSKSPEARCAIMAADGQCCVPEVQRYYLKLRQQASEARDEAP